MLWSAFLYGSGIGIVGGHIAGDLSQPVEIAVLLLAGVAMVYSYILEKRLKGGDGYGG